jgi:hypothetical protein
MLEEAMMLGTGLPFWCRPFYAGSTPETICRHPNPGSWLVSPYAHIFSEKSKKLQEKHFFPAGAWI